MIEFRCVDLPDAGVRLVAASEPEDPVGAVLQNESGRSIAAWTLIWRYEEVTGRRYRTVWTCGVGMMPSLLLPYGMTAEQRVWANYWQVILPGSKRYMTECQAVGDNSDVRAPRPEEMSRGGGMGVSGSARRRRPLEGVKQVTLTMDGVFFADGLFAGPNAGGLWERMVEDAETYRQAGRLARQLLEEGIDAAVIAEAVEREAGEERMHIKALRRSQGAEATVRAVAEWADCELPHYRRMC